MEKLKLKIIELGKLCELQVTYDQEEWIRQAQSRCSEIETLREQMKRGKATDYQMDDKGTVWLKDIIYVAKDQTIRESILKEAHNSKYSIHPVCTKMYQYLKERF